MTENPDLEGMLKNIPSERDKKNHSKDYSACITKLEEAYAKWGMQKLYDITPEEAAIQSSQFLAPEDTDYSPLEFVDYVTLFIRKLLIYIEDDEWVGGKPKLRELAMYLNSALKEDLNDPLKTRTYRQQFRIDEIISKFIEKEGERFFLSDFLVDAKDLTEFY